MRAAKTQAVHTLARATEQLGALRGKVVTLRLHEHAIARFTRNFCLPKGFHTLRNKKMRIEKLVYRFWPEQRRFLQLLVTPGNATLADRAIEDLRALRRYARPHKLCLVLDGGVAQSNDERRHLDRFRKTVLLIRAPRCRA